VLGMTLRDVDGDAEYPRQVWTFGGPSTHGRPGISKDPKAASPTSA